jgi:hypothetical protein
MRCTRAFGTSHEARGSGACSTAPIEGNRKNGIALLAGTTEMSSFLSRNHIGIAIAVLCPRSVQRQ